MQNIIYRSQCKGNQLGEYLFALLPRPLPSHKSLNKLSVDSEGRYPSAFAGSTMEEPISFLFSEHLLFICGPEDGALPSDAHTLLPRTCSQSPGSWLLAGRPLSTLSCPLVLPVSSLRKGCKSTLWNPDVEVALSEMAFIHTHEFNSRISESMTYFHTG